MAEVQFSDWELRTAVTERGEPERYWFDFRDRRDGRLLCMGELGRIMGSSALNLLLESELARVVFCSGLILLLLFVVSLAVVGLELSINLVGQVGGAIVFFFYTGAVELMKFIRKTTPRYFSGSRPV